MKRLILLAAIGIFSCVSLHAQTVTIDGNNCTIYLTDPNSNGLFSFKDVSALRNAKKIVFAATPAIPDTYKGVAYSKDPADSDVLANLEEIVLQQDHKLVQLVLYGTNIKKVTVNNGINTFRQLNIQSASLKQDSIILGSDVRPTIITLHRNFITDLTPLYALMATNLQQLQLNGGKYNRKRHAGADFKIINPTNQIREIDMTKIPNTLAILYIRHNLLDRLENVNHPNLRTCVINNNLLWSADLSSITVASTSFSAGPQKPVADMTVIKGAAVDGSQDEVRLYLPDGQSALFNNSRLVNGSVKLLGTAVATQAIQGTTNKYFKVASVADGTTADLNLYAKHEGFTYQYDTGREGLEDPTGRYMEVKVKTYPYIMYINPASKSSNVNYYSGTLWLDYDAIVPPKTTVWIVTDIKSKQSIIGGGTAEATDQLVLEKIGDPGDLIPAGTAMYVRSEAKEGEGAAGFYAFHKAWTHELIGWDGGQTGEEQVANTADTLWYNQVLTTAQEAELAAQRELIGDRNLLEGYATDKVFDNKREALILGLENQKGTGRIGFWPFNGTVVPAHRAFISEATYRSKVGDANAKGAIFFFNDPETTGITHIQNGDAATKTDDAWYSLDGRRLTGKPTQKGVYIHKGKKEVVR